MTTFIQNKSNISKLDRYKYNNTFTFPNVTGDAITAVIFYDDAGNSVDVNVDVTPDGNDITFQWTLDGIGIVDAEIVQS